MSNRDNESARASSLSAFLLARIAEDEAWAGGPFDFESDSPQPHSLVCGYRAAELTIEEPECICGWPARLLAECEAKRRIVELHGIRVPVYDEGYCDACIGDFDRLDERMNAAYPCDTLRALAAVYAEHEDWREEWS